jgi:putative intracellular protease/amidase
MFDLVTDEATKRAIAALWTAGKPVGAVCHGSASLLGVKVEGGALLNSRRVTGFTRNENTVDTRISRMSFSLQVRISAEGADVVEQPPRSAQTERTESWSLGRSLPEAILRLAARQQGAHQLARRARDHACLLGIALE